MHSCAKLRKVRALMRKAEEGGKMNELLTVHKKEVKNAPMNRPYPPDDEWQECEEGHQPEKNSSGNSTVSSYWQGSCGCFVARGIQ